MITAIAIVFVFGLLIFVHELGHFLVAKRLGVRVEKFSLGFGPELFKIKKGDTEYMICALPLGGYVKLAGDELGTEPAKERWEFLARSPWERNLIVLAGPLMNLILAFVLLSAIFMVGVPTMTSKVGEIKKGFPAELAGLKPNDNITAIDGKPTRLWDDLVTVIVKSPNKELHLTIERPAAGPTAGPAQKMEIAITPKEEVMKDVFGREHRIGLIGITPTAEVVSQKLSLAPAVWEGFKTTGAMTWLTYKGLWMLVTRQVPANSVGGPIMIAKLAGETAKKGMVPLLYFTCIISVTLAVINLLPIPVLDGGHLMFFTIEGIRGVPVGLKAQEISQTVGIALLAALMLFATYNDIVRYFFTGSP